jgi:DMSO reductase anchor subunit
VHVFDTVEFEGSITPPLATGVLLTLTWPDGSWLNVQLQSNDSGGFSYVLYVPMGGPIMAVAILQAEGQARSNTISFVSIYRPISETGNATTSTSLTTPSTSETSTPGGSTTTAPAPTQGTASLTPVAVVLFVVAILVVTLSFYTLNRRPLQKP